MCGGDPSTNLPEWASFCEEAEGDLEPVCGLCTHTGIFPYFIPHRQGLFGQPKHEACHRTRESNPGPAGLEASAPTPIPNHGVPFTTRLN